MANLLCFVLLALATVTVFEATPAQAESPKVTRDEINDFFDNIQPDNDNDNDPAQDNDQMEGEDMLSRRRAEVTAMLKEISGLGPQYANCVAPQRGSLLELRTITGRRMRSCRQQHPVGTQEYKACAKATLNSSAQTLNQIFGRVVRCVKVTSLRDGDINRPLWSTIKARLQQMATRVLYYCADNVEKCLEFNG